MDQSPQLYLSNDISKSQPTIRQVESQNSKEKKKLGLKEELSEESKLWKITQYLIEERWTPNRRLEQNIAMPYYHKDRRETPGDHQLEYQQYYQKLL